MRNWAVICGLVRDRAAFEEKINSLVQWRSEGIVEEIVISTWLGELNAYEGLSKNLADKGVIVLEIREPELILSGHRIHQMKTLAYGLEACPRDSHVLKLRADLFSFFPGLKQVLEGRVNTGIASDPGWPQIFNERIIVGLCLPIQPFFLGDIYFYGLRDDLRKLVTFTLEPELCSLLMNPEQVFHFAPFRNHFQFFLQYFRINPGLIYYSAEIASELVKFLLNETFFLRTLAAWLILLRRYYRIGFFERSEGHSAQAAEEFSKISLSRFLDPLLEYGPSFRCVLRQANAVSTSDDAWISPCLEGKFQHDHIRDPFLEAVAGFTDFESCQNYGQSPVYLSSEAIEFARRLKERFPIAPFVLEDFPESTARSVKIHGRPFDGALNPKIA